MDFGINMICVLQWVVLLRTLYVCESDFGVLITDRFSGIGY